MLGARPGHHAWRRGRTGIGCIPPEIAGIRYLIERDPAYDVTTDWWERDGVLADKDERLPRWRSGAGDSSDPARLQHVLQTGGKIILYHGFSDDEASPYRSIWFYRELADRTGGYTKLQQDARLFMMPGMGHCMGGDGPNSFDTLTAFDAWVTRGNPPESIPATSTGRTMPLCPFPAAARYLGGPVTYAGSWTCPWATGAFWISARMAFWQAPTGIIANNANASGSQGAADKITSNMSTEMTRSQK